MKKIRWGIAGPGKIANKFAQAIKNVECAELTAVASRTPGKGEEFADKYSVEYIFDSYEKMAESPLVDAVYIATPHPFHKTCAEIFLSLGKHVLCEKPMCINEAQSLNLKKVAEENNAFLMEAMWTRFLPALNEAQSLIKNGAIGNVLSLEADFCYNSSHNEDAKIFKQNMAGGALLDVGVYCLHFADMFMDSEPKNIYAVSDIQNNVDTHTNIVLKYPGGEMASLSCATKVGKPASAYIYGSEGYIYIPLFYGADKLYIKTKSSEECIEKPYIGNGFEEEIYEVCNCIAEGKLQSDILPVSETIKIIKQMDEIRKQNGIRYPFEGEDF